jgi:hypothetical protein
VDVDTGYWFVTEKGKFGRVGYLLTPEIQAEVGRAIAIIVDGVNAGIFPCRPPSDPSFGWVDCWYCTPDGLSGAEARRDWERKRSAPVLGEYVGLVEPEFFDDAS